VPYANIKKKLSQQDAHKLTGVKRKIRTRESSVWNEFGRFLMEYGRLNVNSSILNVYLEVYFETYKGTHSYFVMLLMHPYFI
jgi:hypothetical protein